MQNAESNSEQLGQLVREAITKYFCNLDGTDANNIYALVIDQIERPLLETVMHHANKNQSKAAQWLGLSRNTLRKLLAKYNIS